MKKEIEDMFLDCDIRDLEELGFNRMQKKLTNPDGHKQNVKLHTVRHLHPLLNKDSSHYEMVGGMEAIEMMESMFTIEELKAWAKLTAMKYRLRIGKKDDPSKEIKKIYTFEAYYRYLDTLPTSVNSLS